MKPTKAWAIVDAKGKIEHWSGERLWIYRRKPSVELMADRGEIIRVEIREVKKK